MWSQVFLLDAAVIIPGLAAVVIGLCGRWANLRDAVSLLAGALLVAVNLQLYLQFNDGQVLTRHWLELLPGLELALRPEATGVLFALVASTLWPVTTLYSIGYMRHHGEEHQTRFYACFAIALAATMAIAYAENLFTLFIFYEVLSLATYPLVTHAGTEEARRSGRVYLGFLMGSSIALFLPALIVTWMACGTLSFRAGGIFPAHLSGALLSALLLMYLLGVGKAAVMPIHRWLPAAMVAPTPVSALLHAVAVVKAGVFTLIKIIVFIFGLETLQALPITEILLYFVAAGVVTASLVALQQDNLKARLAYSTISQLGYITLGTLLALESGVIGSATHIAMHAVGKITLFFCAGVFMVISHKSRISEMGGLGRRMPVTMAAFFVASVSIIGLPPTGGTWSKWLLLAGTAEAEQWPIMAALLLSSMLSIAYLMPIPIRGFFSAEPAGENPPRRYQEAPLASLLAISATALLCVIFFFNPDPVYHLATRIFSEAGRP